ncbi:uncharacterized protein LOC111391210 [Olea europaea var. sylvestris]|uniref:uncharacterized protein LOC111391210 n=1 Tax=Olea europaea var. sylvestris TaxID=158386 RepID=UPI000C1CD85F|nr:uncharacterized protein LOC111391210 [Olea europaea var. sylvestris]
METSLPPYQLLKDGYFRHCCLLPPDNLQRKTEIKRCVSRFIFYKGILYRRSFDGVFLRCLTSWSFDAWDLDVIGPITPKSSARHAYIIAKTNYFSKLAEAAPLKEVKKENVVDFIRIQIIYRYGVLRHIITDNGKTFCNSHINNLCTKFGFKQYNLSMYNSPANRLAKAFNKMLFSLLKKVVSKSKRDWHEKIGEVLWAYRTTYRTPTQATPYALVYRVEAVLPLECQIPSLQIAIQEGLTTK